MFLSKVVEKLEISRLSRRLNGNNIDFYRCSFFNVFFPTFFSKVPELRKKSGLENPVTDGVHSAALKPKESILNVYRPNQPISLGSPLLWSNLRSFRNPVLKMV